MPNFNSSEVVEKLSDILNMHDHVRPGSDRLKHAASILAAALESAKRKERASALKELCADCSMVKSGLGLCDACKVQEKLLAIPELDSLAEKEGHQ